MAWVIRWATAADIASFYGDRQPPGPLRALVSEVDGEVEAVGGICYPRGGWPTLFSDIRPGTRSAVRVWKGARAILERVVGDQPVVAVADRDEPGAPRLLERLGFERFGETPEGPMYRFTPRGDGRG